MVETLSNGDVLWFSERTGYGHLYVYDGKTGRMKRALTQGNWTVRNVLKVDEAHDAIYVAGNERQGSDPYYRHIYRVRLSDGHVTPLTPEDADHYVPSAQEAAYPGRPGALHADLSRGFAPSGRYFIDSYSRVDLPAKTVLRTADGAIVADLATTDASQLRALGWRQPERFSALAADGKTMLYGVMWKPSDFDPAKHYAMLDSIYPGPQMNRVRVSFAENALDRQGNVALAELGMVVISVDGRGTPGRSKAFHDQSYGRMGDAGNLPDHIAVLRELARRYAWLDIDRVGVIGSSAGGYAAAHAMFTQPEFYKVGVADAGNHDQRAYLAVWGETYNGPEVGRNYVDAANALLAPGLKGKLLLLHGDMDSNVLPDYTLQVADALENSNKDFELLIVPNQGHTTILQAGYPLRRAWDFLVRNLIGATPPVAFDFSAPAPAK
jgi:dipeptidyl aminopeptidase/acylaminoacyl peptidase